MDALSRGHGPPSFWKQADALLRKNICFQKRNLRTNIRLILFPFVLCILLVIIQTIVNNELEKPENRCGCTCIDTNGDGSCETVCGIQYSTPDQVATCPIPSPPKWPAFLQIPRPEYRAVRTDVIPFTDLPVESCKETHSCPATVLLTGSNRSYAENLAGRLFPSVSSLDFSDYLSSLANIVPGSDSETESLNYIEPAFSDSRPIYIVQSQCPFNFTITVPIQVETIRYQQEVKCVQGLPLWRANALAVNDELFKGYRGGNLKREINEIVAAYDLLDTDQSHFNVRVWYNGTYMNDSGNSPLALVRVPRSLNVASNAYLQSLQGAGIKMLFDFVKEMPKPATKLSLDFSSILGGLFFTWVVLQLFPVILISLVYEKQRNLRLMMKMHGLGDGPYWMISYGYFLFVSVVYMLVFVIFGSLIGLKFFTLNDYSIQFVFFFIYINLQIALGFLAATIFSNVKTASVIGYVCVFGSGLLGGFLFQFFVEDTTFSRGWVLVMEIFPGFSLYRGLYEFAQYAFNGSYMGISGMRWRDLNDADNGMKEVLVIMVVEWIVLLPFAYYLDQVASFGSGIRKHPLFFLKYFGKKASPSIQRVGLDMQDGKVFIDMEKPDVAHEREVVQKLLLNSTKDHAIICDNLKKMYPGKDGNPDKYAVQGLSLALPQGECFGMLGPNGAGKTTFINMLIGLTAPTSGAAFVQGFDIQQDMDKIYTSMGVCPQHDLLWETLTGREHLFFYGRLKNLKGAALTHAVEESLKSVNLFHGGVGDKLEGKYSGGMKRRLSVAISLIGDPKVVYMDEPSTGLDPASRNDLWNVVKRAKQDRAIILTTHSMEEAEVLCDRLGIFVDGNLQCIGNPKELKARYGGSYVFTMTTSSNQDEEVEELVRKLSPNAKKIYHISGTQKFELPKQAIRIADVFQAVENAKKKFSIHAWGLADTTLEDVFIEVARGARSSSNLS
ncbi:hypothetical protein H6P81_009563 [Aristolochia fimbriata]|uniref:ABC transporter domain-containing protein n=1 Tax=Aristolochia fimbriata TaxID=158543 RepID=A0AAV7EQP4_ARIFI|nr:hypothetical protein H6P81_009563 [Aristolochia fimbriata]